MRGRMAKSFLRANRSAARPRGSERTCYKADEDGDKGHNGRDVAVSARAAPIVAYGLERRRRIIIIKDAIAVESLLGCRTGSVTNLLWRTIEAIITHLLTRQPFNLVHLIAFYMTGRALKRRRKSHSGFGGVNWAAHDHRRRSFRTQRSVLSFIQPPAQKISFPGEL